MGPEVFDAMGQRYGGREVAWDDNASGVGEQDAQVTGGYLPSDHDGHMSVMAVIAAACEAERFPEPRPGQSLADVAAPPRVLGAVRARLAAMLGICLAPATVLSTRLIDLASMPSVDPGHLGHPSLAQAVRWQLDAVDSRRSTGSHLADAAYRVHGPIDPEALLRACVRVAARHEVLLSSFPGPADPATGAPAVRRCDPSLVAQAVSVAPPAMGTDTASVAEVLTTPMDLAQGPLFRVIVVPAGPDEWLVCWAFEHMIFDGLSIHIWHREVSACYAAEVTGQLPELSALPCQYYDHAAWQRAELARGQADAFVAQWQKDLAGRPLYPGLLLPRAHARAGDGVVVAAHVEVPADQRRRLADRAAHAGSTPFLVWLASLARALWTLTGQRKAGVVTPTVGRTTAESGRMIGPFANLAVAWFAIDDNEPFEVTLRTARQRAIAALERDILPFSELVRALCPEYLSGRTPDPYCFLNVVTSDQAPTLSFQGVETTRITVSPRAARKRHPGLDVIAVDTGDRWRLTGVSGDDTFARAQIEEVLRHTVQQALDWAAGGDRKVPAVAAYGQGAPRAGGTGSGTPAVPGQAGGRITSD